jgi:murein L,D-transpeptidase YafK
VSLAKFAVMSSGVWSRARHSLLVGAVLLASGAGTAEMAFEAPYLEVWKGRRIMVLVEDGAVSRQFEIALGSEPRDPKAVEGDNRTPVGRYVISDKNGVSRYHRFLGISYPNVDDAERGYAEGRISAGQWANIFLANLRGTRPPPDTGLGGRIGIHGYGGRPYIPEIDWTEGCIAVSDEEVDFLHRRLPVGTVVVIHE